MSETVPVSHVFLNNPASTRDEVLDFLCDEAVALGLATSAAELKEGFLDRETEGSTGMVQGFAVPHAQCDTITEPAAMVVKLAQPVAWETMDGKPVDVAVAILAPTGPGGAGHLRLLSKLAVALMTRDFAEAVRAADDAASVAQVVNEVMAD